MADTKFDIKAAQAAVQTQGLKGLYAAAGAGELAFETAKKFAADQVADVKTRVADLQKKVAGFELPTVEGVSKDAKAVQADLQSKLADLQKKVTEFEFDAKKFQGQATSLVTEKLEALTKSITEDAKELQGKVEAFAADLTKDAKGLKDIKVAELRTKAEARFETFVADVKGYPTKAQTVVTARVNETVAEANTRYAAFVVRGEKAVKALRKSEVVSDVVETIEKVAPAKKAPATKTAAKKAPAKKAAEKKA